MEQDQFLSILVLFEHNKMDLPIKKRFSHWKIIYML